MNCLTTADAIPYMDPQIVILFSHLFRHFINLVLTVIEGGPLIQTANLWSIACFGIPAVQVQGCKHWQAHLNLASSDFQQCLYWLLLASTDRTRYSPGRGRNIVGTMRTSCSLLTFRSGGAGGGLENGCHTSTKRKGAETLYEWWIFGDDGNRQVTQCRMPLDIVNHVDKQPVRSSKER